MKIENLEAALIEVGYRLKVLRLKKGFYTPEEFSNQYDLPQDQYSKMENGKTNITLKSLLKVLQIHKLSLEDFFCLDVKKLAA